MRLLKLAKESFSLSKTEDEASTIAAEPMNVATPIAKPATRPTRLAQKGIMIMEPIREEQPE